MSLWSTESAAPAGATRTGANFYPRGLAQSRWLEHYATQFDTVEINNSYYRLPTQAAVKSWATRAPAGFTFAVKAARFITHYRRLVNTEEQLDTFVSRSAPSVSTWARSSISSPTA